jgi:hypothetical protein
MAQSDYLFEEIIHHIDTEDIEYFQGTVYAHAQLHEIFYYCCYKNKSPAFTDAIIELGVSDFVHGCVTGALLSGHYRLLEHILTKYGKSHRINLFEYGAIDICHYVSSLVQKKENLKLFEMIVEALPNHTQIIKKKDKYYSDEKNRYDLLSYEFICQVLLANTIDEYRYSTSQCGADTIKEAIKIISRKKFPLSKTQSMVIQALEDSLQQEQTNENDNHDQEQHLASNSNANTFSFKALFEGRLKPRHGDIIDNRIASPQAMASHHTLNSLLTYSDVQKMKLRLYLEVTHEMQVPLEIGNIMYYALTHDKTLYYQRKLISAESVRWMQSFKDNQKHYVFNFFNRYINFERSLLPLTLQTELEHYDTIEADDSCVKI